MLVYKSWLWTCVIPTLASCIVFILLLLLGENPMGLTLPMIFVSWGIITISSTFIVNLMASFVVSGKSRVLQLTTGILLALIMPFVIMMLESF